MNQTFREEKSTVRKGLVGLVAMSDDTNSLRA